MEQKKELNKRAKAASKTITAYRRLFSTEDGQIVLQDLMSSCFLTRSTIGTTPYETYYNEGARAIVLRLIQQANLDEKQVERIIKEMNKVSEDIHF